MDEKKYILKIESEICGGSLSIFEDRKIFYEREGFLNGKKSDYINEVLKDTLADNQIRVENIKSIIYSKYPGSQMGLKILASIIKGMSLPYKIDVSGKNLFESITDFYVGKGDDDFCVMLPLNEREFMLEFSTADISKSGNKLQIDLLPETLSEFKQSGRNVILPLKFFETKFNSKSFVKNYPLVNFIDTGNNLSKFL